MSAENKTVKTEFEEKIIATSAGDAALLTANCKSSILIPTHSTPSRAILKKSATPSLILRRFISNNANGRSTNPPRKKRKDVMTNGLTSPEISLPSGSSVVKRIAVINT